MESLQLWSRTTCTSLPDTGATTTLLTDIRLFRMQHPTPEEEISSRWKKLRIRCMGGVAASHVSLVQPVKLDGMIGA